MVEKGVTESEVDEKGRNFELESVRRRRRKERRNGNGEEKGNEGDRRLGGERN